MSVAPLLSPVAEAGPRRMSPRHGIDVALDVIALRSGIPESVPGRCIDISELGIGAAVAGELAPNQHVAIEMKLPHVALPLRARATVRHHNRLRCGLQFVNLSAEQCEMIRFWIHRSSAWEAAPTRVSTLKEAALPPADLPAAAPASEAGRRRTRIPKSRVFAILAFMLVLAVCLWWYWQREWRRLESSLAAATQVQTYNRGTIDTVIVSEAKDLDLATGI